MNKWTELLFGLILIIGAIVVAFYSQTWGMWDFWTAAGEFFKGGLFWVVVLIGTLFVLLGISDLKESVNKPNHTPRPEEKSTPKRKK